MRLELRPTSRHILYNRYSTPMQTNESFVWHLRRGAMRIRIFAWNRLRVRFHARFSSQSKWNIFVPYMTYLPPLGRVFNGERTDKPTDDDSKRKFK